MILAIDDDIAGRTSLSLLLKQNGYEFRGAESPRAALQVLAKQRPELILLDLNYSIAPSGRQGLALLEQITALAPGVPVILLTGWGTMELAVRGMKAGARDFLTKPWDNEHLLQSIRTCLRVERAPTQDLGRRELNRQFQLNNIVGEHPALLHVLETVARVSTTDASILILGESGTGKELIAEAIHENSRRQGQAFVKVNLGGISTTLFESEMFGHKKGAFTDAYSDRVGRFERAHRGTIFLDEIGELDKSAQVKLLRVLQERSFEPLGSSRPQQVDIRLVSATNRKLEEMVAAGNFREDLFYRINLITVQLPALRERASDIPLLVRYFVDNLRELYQRPELTVSRSALGWLRERPFPGNIRQLKNVVERAVLVAGHDALDVADFEPHLQNKARKSAGAWPAVGSLSLEEMEIQMIRQAMRFHQNQISKVARALGLSRGALYRRLDKYQIPHDR